MTKDEALDLALEALESCGAGHITDGGNQWHDEKLVDKAITAIKQARALDKKAENARELGLDYEPVAWVEYETGNHTKRPQNCGTGYCSCVECVMEPAPVQSAERGEPVAFFDWYDNAHWGNEDFKEGCHRAWNAAIKYTTPPAQPAPMQDSTCNETLRAQGKEYPRTCRKCGLGPCIGAPKQPPTAQRQWVGLTDEEMDELVNRFARYELVRATENLLRSKNA
ncbi:MAG: hypothetical protein RJA69_434 [Pseudomonadota bacterium]